MDNEKPPGKIGLSIMGDATGRLSAGSSEAGQSEWASVWSALLAIRSVGYFGRPAVFSNIPERKVD